MKKVISALLIMMACETVIAQNLAQEAHLKYEADKYYKEEQYNLAVQYYRELSNITGENAEANYQLAESYRKTFNYKEAETYYLKTSFQSPEQFPLAEYNYALMLKLNGEFDESIKYFTSFIRDSQNKSELNEYREQAMVDRAGSEMAKSVISKNDISRPLKSENINTGFNDYAPTLLDSGTLVITSGRVASNREAIDERYGEGFTDNFYFTKNGNAWQDKTKQLFRITNTRFNDGSGSFNRQGNKYYFTVCGKEGPQCRIFLSVLKHDKWTNPVALNDNINFKTFEARHPSVSRGGDTLLFSSNRSGGFGNFDIWMSINAGNENWGPAMNMGSTVNTKLNEISPSFAGFSHVFFLASDGHQNYGGMDLYMAKRFSNGTMALYNLDYPFNSNRDDCFITFGERKLYFSSNRAGGKGGFDVYSVPVSSLQSFVSKLSLKNRVSREDVKLNSKAEKINYLDLLTARNEDRIEYENLTYEKKMIVKKMISNQTRNITNSMNAFQGLTREDYEQLLQISQTKFKTLEVERQFGKSLLTSLKTPVDSSQEVSITGVLKDSLSGKILPSFKILLMNEMGEVLKITRTNEFGKFRFTNIPPGSNLYLRYENISDESTKPKIHDLIFIGSEYQNTYNYENIYFDFDHYTLRNEAMQVLNELADFLKSNPAEQVEINAYADDRGGDTYNMILSQKRGQAVLDYLNSLGVDQTAIAVIAKGRQKNASSQLDIQRQYNRRVEFYINGEKANSIMATKTYIIKKKSDYPTLSRSTGVGVEILKKLNGAVNDELMIYAPVRIPCNAKAIPDSLFFTIVNPH